MLKAKRRVTEVCAEVLVVIADEEQVTVIRTRESVSTVVE